MCETDQGKDTERSSSNSLRSSYRVVSQKILLSGPVPALLSHGQVNMTDLPVIPEPFSCLLIIVLSCVSATV